MPSKIEHEFTKLRGEVSDTGEIYTDTIAALNDKITTLETTVVSLDAELETNKQKADRAMRKASKAITTLQGKISKEGGTLTDTKLDECEIKDCKVINDVTGAYPHGKLGMHNNKLCIGTGSAWEIITSAIIE